MTTDYQALYKALQVRCSQVAEKLRFAASHARQYAKDSVIDPAYVDGLADTLDTPIAVDEAARILSINREDVKCE